MNNSYRIALANHSHFQNNRIDDGYSLGTLTLSANNVMWSSNIADIRHNILIVDIISLSSGEFFIDKLTTSVIIITKKRTYVFLTVQESEISVEMLLRELKKRIDSLFQSQDEIKFGSIPRRRRGVSRSEIVLSLTDLSWGETDQKPIKVEIAHLEGSFAWKKRVFLADDVHKFILKSLDELTSAKLDDVVLRCKNLGIFLLKNTISVKAMDEIRKLQPSFITLRVDELLSHLPWGILNDGNEFLQLAYAVAQQVSTVNWDVISTNEKKSSKKILLIENPTHDLPGTEEEIKSIISLIQSAGLNKEWTTQILRGENASRINVLFALASGDYDIIHYAGHSTFNASESQKSYWNLSDGPLYAYELQQNLEGSPPSLVFASSCESGREENRISSNYNKAVFGLASAFLNSGVKNYIGGFWPIEDNAAMNLAVEFYKLLLNGLPVVEALRLSKVELMKNDHSPLAWTGVSIYGTSNYRI